MEEVKRDLIHVVRLPKPFLYSSPVQQISTILLSSNEGFLHVIRDAIKDYNKQLRVRCYVKEWILVIRKLIGLASIGTYTTHIAGNVKSTEVLKDYLNLSRLQWKWDYLETAAPGSTMGLLTKSLQKMLKDANVKVPDPPVRKKKSVFDLFDPRKLLKVTTQAVITELDPLKKAAIAKTLTDLSCNVLQNNIMIEYTEAIVSMIEAGVDDSIERRLYKSVDDSISEHERKSL